MTREVDQPSRRRHRRRGPGAARARRARRLPDRRQRGPLHRHHHPPGPAVTPIRRAPSRVVQSRPATSWRSPPTTPSSKPSTGSSNTRSPTSPSSRRPSWWASAPEPTSSKPACANSNVNIANLVGRCHCCCAHATGRPPPARPHRGKGSDEGAAGGSRPHDRQNGWPAQDDPALSRRCSRPTPGPAVVPAGPVRCPGGQAGRGCAFPMSSG